MYCIITIKTETQNIYPLNIKYIKRYGFLAYVVTALEQSEQIVPLPRNRLVQPGQHVTYVALGVVGVHLDRFRGSARAPLGESVEKGVNQQCPTDRTVLVCDVPIEVKGKLTFVTVTRIFLKCALWKCYRSVTKFSYKKHYQYFFP